MRKNLKSYSSIFFDFDGVIKDSVEIKSIAFGQLFIEFGGDVYKRVRTHHEKNGGMSRFEKLPLYLRWAEQKPSLQLIDEYAIKFSQLVKKKVVDSAWVDGVFDYLKDNYNVQQFFLVTATPQKEIEEILYQLKIIDYFKQIIGSPTTKSEAIMRLSSRHKINPDKAVMIGDSQSDYKAALDNNINFILRKTELNTKLQHELNCTMIDNFL